MLLEAAFLGHSSLLFLSLYLVALLAEIAELAFKHLIFADLTLQGAVEHRNLDRRFQSYLVEAFLSI